MEVLKSKDIANRFALEIERRIAAFPDRPTEDFSGVRCEVASVTARLPWFSDQDLCSTMDNLVTRVSHGLDEAAELLKAVSSGLRPVFIAPDELPCGLDHSEYGKSGEVEIRYLRGYNIVDNMRWALVDMRVVGTRWIKTNHGILTLREALERADA